MKPSDFIQQLDEAQVAAAIAKAEQSSSGEVRVYVSSRRVEDPLEAAREQFVRLSMDQTKLRNGVLLFFAPASQQFAVVGDTGVHDKCGQPFWEEMAAEMTQLLKQGRLTEAVAAAIHKAGQMLAQYFPRQPDDRNELPDKLITG